MEHILQNTDIFSDDIDKKLNEIILLDENNFNKEVTYRLTVSFHVNLLYDSRFEEFNIPVQSVARKECQKNKVYDVMSFQLGKIKEVFSKNNIKIYSTGIKGDNLELEDIIKIDIKEDDSEAFYSGRGKNKKRIKVSTIMPSAPYIQEVLEKSAPEGIRKIYYKFLNVIRSKKIMSEILGIEATEDDRKLEMAFEKQYGKLWFTTNELEKELKNKLMERSLFVLNKCSENNKENENDKIIQN